MARRRRSRKNQQNIELWITAAVLVVVGVSAGGGLTLSSQSFLLVLASTALVLAVGSFIAILLHERRRAQRFSALDYANINTMPGTEFEAFVSSLLHRHGYRTTLTPINDYGVDVVAKKQGIKYAVQVKRYNKPVSQAAVREAVAGMLYYKCSKAMVITNSTFTKSAIALAESNHCELIDGEKLGAMILAANDLGAIR